MRRTTVYLLILLSINIILYAQLSSAASCWSYTTNATCSGDSGCLWKSDDWGSYCQELNCWSLTGQTQCTTTSVPGKNCSWTPGYETFYCDQQNCWNFAGTSESACENNTINRTCAWGNSCYNSASAGAFNSACWNKSTETSCRNTTGCAWGTCYQQGCYEHTTQQACSVGRDWDGDLCYWTGTNCKERSCWDIYGSNETACNAATNMSCQWKWGGCNEKSCQNFDFTNESACENNTINKACYWYSSYCYVDSCWSATTNASCSSKSGCQWKSWTTSGWCEEVNCWSWDSYKGGSESACVNNSYSMDCTWTNYGGYTNGSEGWCQKDITSTVQCANVTTEKSCADTYYCWWQFNDFNDPSAGGRCVSPGTVSGGGGSNVTILNDWNPGCYIFDKNGTQCNMTFGCITTYPGQCDENNNTYGDNITANGIQCNYINNSDICNSIPVLSTCCAWVNGSCAENRVSTSCTSQLQVTPTGEKSCEDASSKANCDTIAGSPWYMPCTWDNASTKCKLNVNEVFGNTSQSLVKIENLKTCEAAGGKWIPENYCEGNISVPTGRCESKFDDEDDCDKACYACEKKNSDNVAVNSSNAEEACIGSKLGFCKFVPNTNAPNGIGFCKAKEEWKKGVAGDCNTNCGDCTFKGDAKSNNTEKKPNYYCANSKANSAGGGCKWISDNTTSTKGYCVDKGEKVCEDSCDRCTTQNECSNQGRINLANQTGSCKWQGTENDGACVANSGEDVEVCWDGIDNDDNNLIDCSDPTCYSDSFCGFVEGDCFGWTTNATCTAATGCEWVIDKWGSWCDFKGSQCWKYDKNSSVCQSNAGCEWNSGSGTGFCERDWSAAEVCMGLNITGCLASSGQGCSWTNDSWCAGYGKGTDWCNSNGGWCDHNDFKPKDCWQYTSRNPCTSAAGCEWSSDQWSQPHCEVNWSGNCWNNFDNSSCTTAGCLWRNENWGGYDSQWCENSMNVCYSKFSESDCEAVSGNKCMWRTESWGSYCEPACFNPSTSSNQTPCEAISGCLWKAESGWCQEAAATSCYNVSISNEVGCEAQTGCKWKNPGWCSPKDGFSMGGAVASGGFGDSSGSECFRYDGTSKDVCTNKTKINITCGWTALSQPECDIDWAQDCWTLTTEISCNGHLFCWWKSDAFGSSCLNVMDQCWNNMSLVSNATLCNNNVYCNATEWGCEPTCFSATTEGACPSTCKWTSGLCDPAGRKEMFDEMEGGAPAPLGFDTCDGETQPSVDICGFGMKDMKESFGFGTNVNSFRNASSCNKISVKVGPGQEFTGAGNDTVELLVYLDTDGSTSGGCALSHNSTALGYEFRFRYSSVWSINKSKAEETFTASKCSNSEWASTDIKLSAWNKKMCSEIGGPMLAVQKADLSKHPTLYNSTKDMRVYVATIGNTGNSTNPSDTAGPGWTTPGSVDFEIKDAFSYGADVAKFEDILKKGYVQYEDCFNSFDDDFDGKTDCNDYECEFATVCEGLGVNVAGYSDNTSPLVSGVRVEEYPDAALVMYDTNKPANGTLKFYYNDSACSTLNATVYDIGITSATVRDYKLWHTADVYRTTIGYNLANQTTYYYKLNVCDSGGKCALSKCSSFITSPRDKCGLCNFVARIKTPPGWTASYDANQNGVYEHVQGKVCGPNAGMKMNYTLGRKVNIKLNDSTESTYFEFINASLTKTALNDKVRTLGESGDIISTSTYTGLTSESRDKLINNLHPEVCRVKIPFTGTCDKLYHCGDSGTGCVDKTSSARLVDSTLCVWEIPYCEFSTYRESTSSSDSSSSSGGGGSSSAGGGGGGGGLGVPSNVAARTSQFWSDILKTTPVLLKSTNKLIAVYDLRLQVNKDVKDVSVSLASLKEKPVKVSLPVGKANQYLEITATNLKQEDVFSISIKFEVPKSWITSNNIEEPTIRLQRYADIWKDLPTNKIASDNDNLYFEATSPGFSYFVIVGDEKKLPEAPAPVEEKPAVLPPEEPTAAVIIPPKKISSTIIGTIAIIVILALVASFFYLKSREQNTAMRRKRL